MPEEPTFSYPPSPERPPVGENHVLHFPDVPSPMPLSEYRPSDKKPERRTLVVGPLSLLMREDVRPWLQRLAKAQLTAGRLAGKGRLEVLPDAEAEVDAALDRLVAEKKIGTLDGKKTRLTRGVRLARSAEEWTAIWHTREQVQSEVQYRFIGAATPSELRVEMTVRRPMVSIPSLHGTRELSHLMLAPASEFARLVHGEYDQFVFLVTETGKSRVIKRERRNPKGNVIVFPDEDQGADWPKNHPA